MAMFLTFNRILISTVMAILLAAVSHAKSYVQFDFRVTPNDANPFAREIFAEIAEPDGTSRRLPAFHTGNGVYAVRAYTGQGGEFRLAKVTEDRSGGGENLPLDPVSASSQTTEPATARGFIRIDPANKTSFADEEGRRYIPVGMNVAWPDRNGGMAYYRQVFPEMATHGLNWSRVWMSHWGELNLDWFSQDKAPSPKPGDIDPGVAANWDQVIEQAEASGIRLQVVLQHHGQYSTRVNPNWDENPWSAAAPHGFLATPVEFFTSEDARRFTRQKYRYIVARWGYSPAVMAWELFNEVQFTDALMIAEAEPAVAAWHAEMAAYLRKHDTYEHLVTTSYNDLHSPITAEMDYQQPHLYAPNMIASVRLIHNLTEVDDSQPVFYGEIGDEQMVLTPEQVESGVAMLPPVWASLAGAGSHPAQIWYGNRMVDTGRIPELGALAKLLQHSRYTERVNLTAFDVPVKSADTISLVVPSGHWWTKSPSANVAIPEDGREPAEYATVARALVGKPADISKGYPHRASFRANYPHAATMKVSFGGAGPKGGTVQVLVDQREVARHVWPNREQATPAGAGAAETPMEPVEIAVDLAKGQHLIEIQNVGGADTVLLDRIDFGLPVPKLAAVGKRNAEFVYLWIWNREGVFAVDEMPAARATLSVPELQEGSWRVTWWDSLAGKVLSEEKRAHGGGTLELETPAVARHAAVILEKL